MENEKLKTLARTLPTPAYVFDTDLFRQRAALVREAFGEKTGLCFSIKANPFLLAELPEFFDKIEVCSPGELTICEKTNADMEKVIFSGVNKTAPDVKRAMQDQVGTFTAESLMHVRLVNEAAMEQGQRVPVLLRLTGGSQFGMDEEELLQVIRERENYPGIEIVGLHYFTGTQKRKPAVIEKELDQVEAFLQKVQRTCSYSLRRVEYGTGLAVDYFTADAQEQETQRLLAVAPRIRALAEKTELTVEMGRFFAAPCGYYLTKVIDTKCNCGVNYAIVDGGLNQLKYDGQIQGMQIPEILHIGEKTEAAPEKWTLCGSLCTTADVLARNVEFQNLQPEDILIFGRTGAYSAMEGMAIFLSREMPVISLYSAEKGIRIVRERIHTDIFNTAV